MRDLRKKMNNRDLLWLTVFVLLVGGVGGALLERVVLPYVAAWPGANRLKILSPQTQLVITKREEIRINEGVNQLEVGNRVKNSLLMIYAHEGKFLSGDFRVVASRSAVVVSSDGVLAVPADGLVPVQTGRIFTAIAANGEAAEAKFLAFDRLTGIMFLRVNRDNLPVLRQKESARIQSGERLLAVWGTEERGVPRVHPLTAIAPGTEPPSLLDIYELGSLNAYLQTDWIPSSDALGSAIVDKDGQLVGLLSKIGKELVVLRVEDLKILIDKFLAGQGIHWPNVKLSYQIFSENQTAILGIPKKYGVLLKSGAGQLREDDFIFAVNGRELSPSQTFQSTILSLPAGEKVKLKLIRDQVEKEVEIVL